jgi:uncharacterized protein YbaR (Trm112 family)
MPVDSLLLEILVDPIDRGPLWYFEERELLFNPRTRTAYDVIDSIAVVKPDTGRTLDDAEAAELEASRDAATRTGPSEA